MQIFGSDLPPWVSVKPGTGQVHYLVIRDVECKVLSKTPKIVMVHVYHYPHEGSDLDDIAVLVLGGEVGWGWGYSKVKDCTRQHWPNLPAVHTVTRLVKMEVKQPIPRNLNIGGIGVKIWHMGQPARCDVCANGHVTAEWLLKGLCRSCKPEGHIARNYPSAAWRRLQAV